MRRPITVLLAACLVAAATASMASAQSPSPPPYPEGTGVTFEPAGPSVWRAIEPDWDCDAEYPRQPFYGDADVASDGSVWFLDRLRGVRRLGSCPILGPQGSFSTRDQALGPDGTLWVLNEDRLWSWDGTDWLVHLEGFNQPGRSSYVEGGGYSYSIDCEAGPCYLSVDVAPDGRIWLSGNTVSTFDGTEWTDYMGDPSLGSVIGFGPDGSAWVQGFGGLFVIQPSGGALIRPPTAEGSAHSASDIASGLAASFPTDVGWPREVETWSGPEWIARLDPVMHSDANVIRATEALVAAADATLDDLTITTVLLEPNPGNFASIAAVHIPGARALDLLDPVIPVIAAHIAEPRISWRRVGERWVARVFDDAMPGVYPVTFYPAGDTVWVFQADLSLVERVVAELPSQEELVGPEVPLSNRVEVPEAGMAVTFPDGWTVKTEGADLGFIVVAGPERFGTDVRMQPIAVAEPPGQEPGGLPDACTLVQYRPIALTADEFMSKLYGQAEGIGIESLGRDLSFVLLDPHNALTERTHGQYAKAGDDAIALLWCWGQAPHEYLWRSIAESIEFLPAEE